MSLLQFVNCCEKDGDGKNMKKKENIPPVNNYLMKK